MVDVPNANHAGATIVESETDILAEIPSTLANLLHFHAVALAFYQNDWDSLISSPVRVAETIGAAYHIF
jgi:hypothetical protein